MYFLYHEIIYRPLLNVLVFLYQAAAFHDLGIAIIIFTVLVRAVLYPLFHHQTKHTMKMQALQPKLKKIQDEHKGNKEKEVAATMALFAEHGTNPFIPILTTLVQLPILIALYQLLRKIITVEYVTELYAFVHVPSELNPMFLGLINLSQPNTILVGCAVIAQYFQALTVLPKPLNPSALTKQEKTARMTALFAPALIGVFFYHLPSALALYFLTTALISIAQQLIIRKQLSVWKTGTAS